ncbi:hypothetical protein KFK09_016038 [Dendrobium nobile]|uniref:Uncharacterized protein n=1 Tax=Dendrobium nobile TaxID=94219 RepID=A0A8T3B7M6_DENNO|nr:hypothetical protein KFK09_016038 [Dendrobium nobile]
MGFARRSARKVESYLHSQRAPVVASDQNVVTSDPKGRKLGEGAKLNSHEGAEEATRAISTTPAKQRSRTATTKREDESQTLNPRRL